MLTRSYSRASISPIPIFNASFPKSFRFSHDYGLVMRHFIGGICMVPSCSTHFMSTQNVLKMAFLLIWAYLDPCQDVLKLICLEHYICVISPSYHLNTKKCSPITIIYYRACQVQGNCALISERAQLPPLCTLHNVMTFMDLHNGHVEFPEWPHGVCRMVDLGTCPH
jgi:hypothetical protein